MKYIKPEEVKSGDLISWAYDTLTGNKPYPIYCYVTAVHRCKNTGAFIVEPGNLYNENGLSHRDWHVIPSDRLILLIEGKQ